MTATKTSIVVGSLALAGLVLGVAADPAEAQYVTYHSYCAPAPVYVAPAQVVLAPGPVYVPTTPGYWGYCPPRRRSWGYVSYGCGYPKRYYSRPYCYRPYGHRGRSFHVGFGFCR